MNMDTNNLEELANKMGGADGMKEMMNKMGGANGMKEMMNKMGGADGMKEMMNKMGGADGMKEIMGKSNEPNKLTREELKQKLRASIKSRNNNRLSKDLKQQNQIQMLKENPMFQNIGNTPDMKNVIDNMANKLSTDPKQKKNIKKQMEELVEKMKDSA